MMNKKAARPPAWLEALLAYWIPDVEKEAALGDLSELFGHYKAQKGHIRASGWYLVQVWQTAVPLRYLQMRRLVERRIMIMTQRIKKELTLLLVGLVLMVPAILLVSTGILYSGFNWAAPMNIMFAFFEENQFLGWLLHPVVVMMGVGIALVIHLLELIKVRVNNQESQIISTVVLRKDRLFSWAVVGLVTFLLLMIFLYLLAENLGVFSWFRQ